MVDEYVTPTVELLRIEEIITTSGWESDELPGTGNDWD